MHETDGALMLLLKSGLCSSHLNRTQIYGGLNSRYGCGIYGYRGEMRVSVHSERGARIIPRAIGDICL